MTFKLQESGIAQPLEGQDKLRSTSDRLQKLPTSHTPTAVQLITHRDKEVDSIESLPK
jgi:hypothetical protein